MKYFFHGTSADRLKSILEDRKIKCSCNLTPKERVFSFLTHDKGGVFVASSLHVAMSWARIATTEPLIKGDKPQAIILRIPLRDDMKVIDDDLFFDKDTHFMIVGDVEDFEVCLKFDPWDEDIPYTKIYQLNRNL